MSNNQSKETRIIKRIYSKRKTNNPLLVIYPDNKEVWCNRVELFGTSTVQYDKHIVYTTTQEHVVTHIALEKHEKESVQYEPGMVSCAGVEWATEDQEIDFSE